MKPYNVVLRVELITKMFCHRYPSAAKARLNDKGCVLSIGGYDGLHIGHQALLARVRAKADQLGVAAMVMSFEPTPKEFFARDNPPARLSRFRDRFEGLAALGMDGFYCPRFNAKMAALSADEFIDRLLVDTLSVKHLVIGDDFRFGHRASGGVDDLLRAGSIHGFSVEQVGSVYVGGERVSSTLIREALAIGDMERVRAALGHNYQISGRVVHGKKLGKALGYPTANIRLHRRACPVKGIFAVRVHGVDAQPRDAVASVGTRPTVDGKGLLLEVHVFDYDGDLYGRRLTVEFVARLRDEEKYDSIDDLVVQMREDDRQARTALRER